MSIPGMGKAKYGAGGNYAKNFSLVTPKNETDTSSNIYRIFPPIKSQAETGKWALYHGSHFGYRGVDRKDPTKNKMQTFRCVEEKDFRSGIITTECAECKLITSQKASFKDKETQLKASGKGDEEVALILAAQKKWLDDHNVDRKWHMNVINEQGDFGVLRISHKAKKQLDAKMAELIQMGIDPLDPDQGVWFNFKRQGRGIAVQDTVEVVMDRQGVTMTIKLAPLSVEQCKQGLDILPDLTAVVTILSREQIGNLVTCSGDPEEVDTIFGASSRREVSAPARTVPNAALQAAQAAALAAVNKTAVAVTASLGNVALTEAPPVDEEASLRARLEAIAAAKAAKSAAQVVVASEAPPVVSTPVASVASATLADAAKLGHEAFLKMFPTPAAR